MKIYRQKAIQPKLYERIFVAPQQGIAPQGMNTLNRYTPMTEYLNTKIVPEDASAFIGHKNPNIGSDINTVRRKLQRKFESGEKYSRHRINSELPFLRLDERSGIDKQFNNGKKYVQPSTEEYITAADTLFKKEYRGKRILRIDALDSNSAKAADFPKYQEYLGPDSGEVRLSKSKELGKDALISVPKDSGFNRYNDHINGGQVKVKPDDKRLRKLLKKNHRLINGLDRSTLEFMYGTKNPNIEKMIKNAKRIL
ncbi:MAG: hypothetical protein MJZ33_05285 [Paludibacteraceae bacterium]|nr:hypothetical protein [Paludibacteraceae bacterium]